MTHATTHRVPIGAEAGRPVGRAVGWLALLGGVFFLSYGAANELAARQSDVASIVFDWERNIPFLEWTILPYWSIDLLYALSFFLCATRAELDRHAFRLLTAQAVAIACFLLFPLQVSLTRPETSGVTGFLFDLLAVFDRPYNQAPSLHMALLVVLWALYAKRLPARFVVAVNVGGGLVAVSVLTTYQHHFVDLPTGFALGMFCLWLWPEDGPKPLANVTLARDGGRRRLAAIYLAAALVLAAAATFLGGVWLWLFWPALSLALVAGFYAAIGVPGFQKGADGRLSLPARWLLAPYLAGAWLNSRAWTWRCRRPVRIAGFVWLGRLPGAEDETTDTFATVIDLSAELGRRFDVPRYLSLPMLDLVVPTPEQLIGVARAIEASRRRGAVLVACALGYGRSAAALATWLVASGRVPDVDAAVDRLRAGGRSVALSPAWRRAIERAAREGLG
ncbi:MAG: phosphatase PAP2/dual specificity phosphatase family protein [Alphaproteobacteria bacterium]|jgi:protein-tyrosine phosphatase/membrane-associated phospholipid phosphatase|nr:phosphatase PAP2/dual specificity phosphatase family protein [Alphaproteobacteria bacterium]